MDVAIGSFRLKPKIEREGCFFNNNKTPGVGAYNMPITLVRN